MKWSFQKRPATPRPGSSVILALGSGAARGWAHIGVIRALRENDIRITGVAGASMGALVGGVFAAGGLEDLAGAAGALDWRRLLYYFWDVSLPRSGLIDGRKIVAFIRHYVTFDRIERLPIPFRAVAADVTTGGEVVLSDGDALEAIRASISVPGMFTPVNRRGVLLVDGGIVNPIPVSVARTLGNDPVLAVDVNHFESRAVSHTESTAPRKPAEPRRHALPVEANRIIDQIQSRLRERWPRWDSFRKPTDTRDQPSLFEVLGNSVRIMESQIAATRLAIDKPDWLIRPSLGDIRFMDFHRAEEIIRRGHAAVKIAR